MSKLNSWRNSHMLRLGLALAFGLVFLIGLLLPMSTARSAPVATVQHAIDGDPRPQNDDYNLGANGTDLVVIKQASPDPVQAGAKLTYTIRVTNTSSVDLHATITDTLPTHIITGQTASGMSILPGGTLTWTPIITLSGGIWTKQIIITVEMGYSGTLTNLVQVTTDEGPGDVYTATSTVLDIHIVYLPIVIKPPPPWITITKASGGYAWGTVGPSSFCNTSYKVALYVKVKDDIWYVQPLATSSYVQIKPNCTWQSLINDWDQVAAHLVPVTYPLPPTKGPPAPPCPPLNPDVNSNVLATSCYP